MKDISIRCITAFFCALLMLFLSGCAQATDTSEYSAVPTANPNAYSILYTAAPTSTASPTAEPTAEPSAEPTAAPEASTAEITVEIETIYPLLEAHTLALLNGGTYSSEDPEYFWRVISFAIDNCGLDFYTAETVGSELLLSRGVIEEMASGLFEGGGAVLLEIPDSLSTEIKYDSEADAFSHPLNEGSFVLTPTGLAENNDGTLTLTADFFTSVDAETPAASLTAVLVPNTRSGNSLFTYAIRSIVLAQ